MSNSPNRSGKSHKSSSHPPELNHTSLSKVIKKFNLTTVQDLYKINAPSKKFKNLILSFLTLFHNKLDYLVEDSPDPETVKKEKADCIDLEWLTIKSFFRNSQKVLDLIKKAEFYLFENMISEDLFKKSAKIYHTVLLSQQEKSKPPDDFQEYLHDLIDMFIIYTFDLEMKLRGTDYLEIFDEDSCSSGDRSVQ